MVDGHLLSYFNGDELAANVWKSKYAAEGEITPDDMHRRLAKEFARIEEQYIEDENAIGDKNKQYEAEKFLSEYGGNRKDLNEESIYNLFKDFKYIVPQGSIMSTLGTDVIASLSNCFVAQSPYDSYGGILKTDSDLAYYYKRRGGVGTDISNLRPAGTNTNNTAKSTTGAVSFMHRFSNTTREVAMQGRRGALMLSIDINHPDVMDFIKVKRDGVSVTGANISIRLNNEFMKAVENDEDYILRFPCNLNITGSDFFKNPYNELIKFGDGFIKKIKAKEYWNEIIHSAKNYAEPGLMYWDNVMDYDPAAVYEQYRATCSNPCGEQFLNPNDSCRLMALNLFSFVDEPFTKNAKINTEKLYSISYEHCRLGDDLIDLELEYIERIINKIKSDPEPDNIKQPELDLWIQSYNNTKAGRRIGLGITALADMLAALNLKYDSDEALRVIDKVMSIKMEAELDCTIDLSILRGSFEGFESNDEFVGDGEAGMNSFYQFIVNKYPEQAKLMSMYGRRNISWSTIAPTGSVSILTQSSSGCEPLFMPYYMRRKKINPSEVGVRIDFVDEVGDSWQEFAVLHPKFKDWCVNKYGSELFVSEMSKQALKLAFETSPWYGSTANDINWIRRVEIQSILQKYTTNAISSTINLPSTVTEDEVSAIYMQGWKIGLKGQTVYVDGSRSGVLVSTEKKETSQFEYRDAPKRPKNVPCETHLVTKTGVEYLVAIGLFDGKPYEIFAFKNQWDIPKVSHGEIIKVKKNHYNLTIQNDVKIENITNVDMSPEEEDLTRMVSMSLRHGADIAFVVEQLNKTKNIASFSKAMARVLKKYIPEGKTTNGSCPECSGTLVYEEGCKKCISCGFSAC